MSVNQLFDLVMRKVSKQQMRLTLCLYDTHGDGYLGEKDLENFIFDQIQGMPKLATLDPQFYPTYVVFAARKFFFYLDTTRCGKIKIKDLLMSDILDEFGELQEEDLPANYEESNYFSVSSVTRIHGSYITLDVSRRCPHAWLFTRGLGVASESFPPSPPIFCNLTRIGPPSPTSLVVTVAFRLIKMASSAAMSFSGLTEAH